MYLDGILEKFKRDAMEKPDEPRFCFLDCEHEPYTENYVTIGEAWRKSMDIASELRQKGAKPGDRAIILSMQDAGTVYAVLGCMMAGVIFTVIPPPIDSGKLSRFISVLKSCSPKFLISNEGMEKSSDTNVKGDLLKGAFKQVVSLKRIYTDKVPIASVPDELIPHKADDVVYLQYTSGSTSAPKGVMITYGTLMACIDQCVDMFDFTKSEHRLASWVPFYHNIGLVVSIFLPLIATKGVAYMIPTLQFLARPTVWLKVMSDYKTNITAAPNSAYEVITRLVKPDHNYDLRHVTHLINGSEFVSASTIDRFCRLFGIHEDAFAPGYGLSECVCLGSLACMDYRKQDILLDEYRQGRFVPDENGEKSIVSVGRPADNMVIVATRSDGTVCDPGEIGEVCIQGPNVCCGYWQNEEESKRFEAKVVGLDGNFYRTGDMGVMYDGQLYLTGRIKEMLIINGKNIFPSDITLMLHEQGNGIPVDGLTIFPAITDGGEVPILCAEVPYDADFASLAAQINRLTAKNFDFSFAEIVFVKKDSLPRTDNRKVKTLACRALYEDGKLNMIYTTAAHGGVAAVEESVSPAALISADSTPEEIHDAVRAMFEKLLPVAEFDDDQSFLELGGDSLAMVELVCDLEHNLGFEIDLRQAAAEPTVAGLTKYVCAVISGEDALKKLDLRSECVLDDDIRMTAEYDFSAEDCKNVFVTGVTGFVGAYLIKALAEQRGGKGVKIFAHVRAADEEKGMERIISNMKRFNCWNDDFRRYIVPVTGDLNLPYLGMTPEKFASLADEIDMVIHNGAVLNFVLPYLQMKRTNVLGTAECLRFVCTGRAKYFHYVSSYSAYDNPSHFDKVVYEDDPMDSPDGYFLGYSETKWVSEKLVQIARERGVRAAIYRPGDITGTKADGIWKLEDLISRSIVGCIQLGAMPAIEVNLHLTPVDFVADAIVHIAFQQASVGHAFNLLNHKLMKLENIPALSLKAGYPVERISYEEWCERLTACSPDENVLRVLACLFTDKKLAGEGLVERFGEHQAEFDTSNTDMLLSGSGITCPPVDEALMAVYLKHFESCGYLPAPIPKWKRVLLALKSKLK